jgi:hypothetical protein
VVTKQPKGKMKTKIDEITISEAREIAALFGSKSASENPFNIGANYFIRTVTHHHTGKLVQVTSQELVLENAAWIADDGRLTGALSTCEFNEVEMFPPGNRVIIGRGSIIDATEILALPTSQK